MIAKRTIKAAAPVTRNPKTVITKPKAARPTEKKWNVVKPVGVKSLSEIQKELERR